MTALLILFLISVLQAEAANSPGKEAKPANSPQGSSATTNSVDTEYRSIEDADDAAQAEIEKWMQENTTAKNKGAGLTEEEMQRRIEERLAPVQKAYQDFLQRYPEHARAHLAYGCFLNDRQDEAGAQAQWEKALELDPSNPDVYNNLAGSYTEHGPVKRAFEFYEKAISLNPKQPLYYHNFAGGLYVLRKKAMVHYGLDEQQVLAKIIQLYSNSVRLAPGDFTYASDMAQTFYSLRPFPAEPALKAWSNALSSAHSEAQRQEVYVHLARVTMLGGHLAEARRMLQPVTDPQQGVLKSNLLHNIDQREKESGNGTNPPKEKP